jgi:thioredoxin-like negative regulator of GroEL
MNIKKFALFVVGIVVILYLIYKYDQNDLDVEKLENVSSESTEVKPTIGVYYTEWCGYSQQFLSQLNNGVAKSIQDAGANVKLVDCDKDKETCAKYNVEGFPTIILHSSKGDLHYNGARSGEAIVGFINNNK